MNDDIARRFPLVPRPRPACGPLAERVRDVADLARSARETTGPARQALTARAWNNAALIASDCGLPDLARSLCWGHYDIWAAAQPLDADGARHALEPLINLARLRIRAGDGRGAHQQLDALHHAVRTRGDTVIDGRAVSFAALTRTTDDHRQVVRWLWAVLLAEGIRALVHDGLCSDALAHAERHHGVGRRLLDGRQVLILAHVARSDPTAAIAVLDGSELTTSWERALAACLIVLCLERTGDPPASAVRTMTERYLHLRLGTGYEAFATNLAVTIVELAGKADHPDSELIVTHLARETLAAREGHAARKILCHPSSASRLTERDRRALSKLVEVSMPAPPEITKSLMKSLLPP